MIRLKHIYKSYPLGDATVDVLKDVNLHVRPQEFVSILGPSGSGKSTLMNIIGCLDVADSGEYLLDGEYVDDCTEDQLSEIRGKKIGFIFQQFNLLPELTAYENVEMPLLYHKLTAAQRKERVERTLSQVGLSDRMDHRPSQLSGGQQQRVAIARVLAMEPSIILADEPTGNLDSHSGREIMDILGRLWQAGNTIVLITHDTQVAKRGPAQGLRPRRDPFHKGDGLVIRKIAKLSLRSIFSHKMRSFLTMLGIIIGVMAVVILVSITQSATTGITDSISSMGLPADHRHRHRGGRVPFPGVGGIPGGHWRH